MLWIRIRIKLKGEDRDPYHRDKLDPDSHQSDKLDLDPHQFTEDNPKCKENDHIWALFQGFEP